MKCEIENIIIDKPNHKGNIYTTHLINKLKDSYQYKELLRTKTLFVKHNGKVVGNVNSLEIEGDRLIADINLLLKDFNLSELKITLEGTGFLKPIDDGFEVTDYHLESLIII